MRGRRRIAAAECTRAGRSLSEPADSTDVRPTRKRTGSSAKCAVCWPARNTTRSSTGWTCIGRRSGRWWTGRARGTLRTLGQAYLGRGDLTAARECLEQLRDAQRQQPLMAKADYAAALSDLYKCYRGLGLAELAKACQEEVRGLL